MTVVQEAIQLESEQYPEQPIPEAQLLEQPISFIKEIEAIATETGLIPNFNEANQIAHASDPSVKIDIKTNIDPIKETQFNDGKAAIAAAICGVTRTCADKCCSIGEKALENAGNNPIAVRLELVRTLQKENPDFFNQPNADRLITAQVKEIMASKKTEIPTTSSPEKDIKTATEQSTDTAETKSEQKKPKTELPWNKKLTPQEEKQKMEALTGTYAKGVKIESTEASTTNSNIDLSQPESTPASISKPLETNVEKPTEQKTIETEAITQQSQKELPQYKPKQIIPNKSSEIIQDHKPIESASSVSEPIQTSPKSPVLIASSPAEKPTPIKQTVTPPPQEQTQVIKPEQVSPIMPQERINRHRPPQSEKIIVTPADNPSQETQNIQPPIERVTVQHNIQQEVLKPQIDNLPTQIEQKPKENPSIEIAEQIFSFPDIQQIQQPQRQFNLENIVADPTITTTEIHQPIALQSVQESVAEQIISIPTVQNTESFNTDTTAVKQPITKQPSIETIQFQPPVLEQTIQFPSSEKPIFHSERDTITSAEDSNILSEQTIHAIQINSESQQIGGLVEAVSVNEIPITIEEQTVTQIQIESNQPEQSIKINMPNGNEIKTQSIQTEQIMTVDIQNEKLQPQTNTTHEASFINSDETVTLFTFEDTNVETNSIPEEVIATTEEYHKEPVTQEVNMGEEIKVQEIIQSITQDSLVQLLTSVLSETNSEQSEDIRLDQLKEEIVFSVQDTESVHFDPEIVLEEISSEIHEKQIIIAENEQPISLPELITLNTTEQELPEQITEMLQNTAQEPTIILALPNLSESMLENSEESETIYLDQNDEKTQPELEEKKLETFFIQMMNQEQTLHFFYLIQNITDILAFLHNQNQEEISENKPDLVDINEVAPEELKNDTFGKYDDTVVQTIWPIVQFLLFIQNMQMFIPQNQGITQHDSEFVSGSSFNLQQSHVFQHAL